MTNRIIVGASEARQNFFHLLDLAQGGTEVLVEKKGKPVIKITLVDKKEPNRKKEMEKAIQALTNMDFGFDMSVEEIEKIISDSYIRR